MCVVILVASAAPNVIGGRVGAGLGLEFSAWRCVNHVTISFFNVEHWQRCQGATPYRGAVPFLLPYHLRLISFTSHHEFLLRHRVLTIEPVPPRYLPTGSHTDLSKSKFSTTERRPSNAPSSSAPSATLTTLLYRRTCRTCETDPRRGSKTVQNLASNRRKCPQRRQELSGTRRSRVGFRGVREGRHNCTREDSYTP
jgi:hypothetical protein